MCDLVLRDLLSLTFYYEHITNLYFNQTIDKILYVCFLQQFLEILIGGLEIYKNQNSELTEKTLINVSLNLFVLFTYLFIYSALYSIKQIQQFECVF